MTRLFLDCEWADPNARELVSLALIDSSSQHSFYAEVDPVPKEPTDWVRAVVYPLLEHGDSAKRKFDFTQDLRTFLTLFQDPFVLFDYRADGVLFDEALTGFDLPQEALTLLPPIPKVTKTLILREEVRRGIDRYFQERPELARRKHHAAVDADALRWAFADALARTP